MSEEIHRSLGRLESSVETLRGDVSEIKTDVKNLNNFKWRVAGGAVVLSVLLTILVEAMNWLKK